MQAPVVGPMSWNRFDNPMAAECTSHYDAYGAWQPEQVWAGSYARQGGQAQMGHGNSGLAGNSLHLQSRQMYTTEDVHEANIMGDPNLQGHMNMLGHHAGVAAAAAHQHYNGSVHHQNGHPHQLVGTGAAQHQQMYMAGSHAGSSGNGEESMRPNLHIAQESSDEDEDERRPAEATQEEREEAERVVRQAFKEAKERDRLREKVKKASPADLQALLNARLAKR